MENAMAVASVAGPVYLVLGLSTLLYSKTWQKVITQFQKDHFSLLSLMFINLVVGLIVLQMYSSWEPNVWILVTITGWGMFLKGAFYLLAPGKWIKDWISAVNNEGLLGLAGLVTIIMGAVLSYYVYLV